ncbi:MAG: type II/IV secretion system protein [Verrucomicrobia bacterium]|nr:type II/IV secretion system protein [Verrucomicrobiota bacterium]
MTGSAPADSIVTRQPFPGTNDPFWIGSQLAAEGKITPEQLKSAIDHYRNNPAVGFAAIVEKLGLSTPQQLAEIISTKYNYPKIKIESVAIDKAIAKQTAQTKEKMRVFLPFKKEGATLCVAIADPATYPPHVARLDFGATPLKFFVAPRQEILASIDNAWRIETQISNPTEFYRKVLLDAISERATDVHINPRGELYNVRFRIDGILVHRLFVNRAEGENVVRAAKILARVDTSETRLPLDGGFKLQFGSKLYTFRLSTEPTIVGENAITRIQTDNTEILDFEALGMEPDDIERIRDFLKLPEGIVVVTGPTGSGKTTLLNTMMHGLNSVEEHVLTIEDPVEFLNPNFTQIQVNPKIGLTFATALRSALRQDPDTILVGEIRDNETASIAITAALTGHLCFSTLHTNSAVAAITRLMDIGLEAFLLASSLKGVVAVRLIRRLCPKCKQVNPESEYLQKHYNIKNPVYTHAEDGCAECNHTGYKGRVGIFEVLPLFRTGDSEEIKEQNRKLNRLITHVGDSQNPTTETDILRELLARGLRTLRQDGLCKIEQGVTSMEEVLKATV